MKKLIFCSSCGQENTFGFIDGSNRYHCEVCLTIHYQNPKPTATLICPRNDEILLVQRAFDPGRGEWGLPGGFLELGETLNQGAVRELKEETNLDGRVKEILGTCSHFNSVFGDILLIGLQCEIDSWDNLKAGDDAMSAQFFSIENCPPLAFECHQKIFKIYKDKFYKK